MTGSAADVVPESLRDDVSQFLHDEASLLDEWRLDEWLALFLPDGTYEIPTPDAGDATSATAQYYVADDAELLRVRITRLKSKNAHAENPRSVTHRMIANIRCSQSDDDVVRVRASFIVHRIRDLHADPYLGWYDHLLVATADGLRFRRRRSLLATRQLAPGSRLSFIL